MTELERALLTVGRNLELPVTPDLTGAVRTRLAEGRRPSLFSRRALIVALAVLAVALGAVLAVPQARSTIRDWLGIGNVTIRYVEDLPPVDQATAGLELGEQMSLEEARERAGFRVRVPTVEGLDDPPKVFYNDTSSQVAFLYGSEEKPKLLITQADARGAIEKLVNLNVTERELVVVEPGYAGIWLYGEKHAIFYPSTDHEEPFRLVGNALVYEIDGVTLRIEAEISKDDALRIARSMR
ncbi:MAG: hypothetical protein ACJ750_02130 [Gaiellaceae bacterium]